VSNPVGDFKNRMWAYIHALAAAGTFRCIDDEACSVFRIGIVHKMPPATIRFRTSNVAEASMPATDEMSMTGILFLTSRSTPRWLVKVDEPVKFMVR